MNRRGLPELDTLELKRLATDRDDHKRVFGVTSLFLNRMRGAKKPLDFFVVVVPDFVFTNCRAISRFQVGYGHRTISKREQRLRAQMLDFFESYEPEQYSWSLDSPISDESAGDGAECADPNYPRVHVAPGEGRTARRRQAAYAVI